MRGIAALVALVALAQIGCSLVYERDDFIDGLRVGAVSPAEVLEGEAFVTLLVEGRNIPTNARIRIEVPGELEAEREVELVGAPVVSSDGEAIAHTSFWPVMTGLAEGESAEVTVILEAPGDRELTRRETTLVVRGLDEYDEETWNDDNNGRLFSRIRVSNAFVAIQAKLTASNRIELGGAVTVAPGLQTGGSGGDGTAPRETGPCVDFESAPEELWGLLVPWADQPVCGGSGGSVSGDGTKAGGTGGDGGGAIWLRAPTVELASPSLPPTRQPAISVQGAPGQPGDTDISECNTLPPANPSAPPAPAFSQGGQGGWGGVALLQASRSLIPGDGVSAAAGLGGYEPSLAERLFALNLGAFSKLGACNLGFRGRGGTVRLDTPSDVDAVAKSYEDDLYGCLLYYEGGDLLLCEVRRQRASRTRQARGPALVGEAWAVGRSPVRLRVLAQEGGSLPVFVDGRQQATVFVGAGSGEVNVEVPKGRSQVCVYIDDQVDRSLPEAGVCRDVVYLP